MSRLAILISLAIVATFVSLGAASNSMTMLVTVSVLVAFAALVHQRVVRQAPAVVGAARVPLWREFLACLLANTFRFGVAAVSIAWVVVLVRMFSAT